MGMFDYVKCDYPLPGSPPTNFRELQFQTKDLDCCMDQYWITEDGKLMHETYRVEDHSDPTKEGLAGLVGCMTRIPTGEEQARVTLTAELYWSNVVASGPGIYTRDGEDAHYLEYTVTFVDGQVKEIKEIRNEKHKAMKSKLPVYTPMSAEDQARREERVHESLIGREMCTWWGGDWEDGKIVTVIAENEHEWIVQNKEDKRFQTIARWQRDRCFFDSYADGRAYKDKRKAAWEAERKEYEDHIAQKE